MKHNHLFFIFFIISTTITISTCLQHNPSYKDQLLSPFEKACVCIKNNCGCCESVNWERFGIDGIVCTNITYLPNDYGISVTLTYNNYTLYNETVSARNPPPICIGIPELEDISADICLRLYDLSFEHKHCHGCAEVKVSVYHIIHKSLNIGCFNLPMDYSMSIHSAKLRNILRDKNERFPSVKII